MNATTTRTCSFDGCDRKPIARSLCGGHYSQWQKGQDLRPIARGLVARFEAYTDKSGDCWLWTGAKFARGYGSLYVNGKYVRVHRLSYEMHVGPIPQGMEIDHICHNRACVKPDHLRPATRKQQMENLTPRDDRGVSYRKQDKKWHAYAGHHGRMHTAGFFNTKEEAAEAARILRNELFTHNDADRRINVSGR